MCAAAAANLFHALLLLLFKEVIVGYFLVPTILALFLFPLIMVCVANTFE